MKITLDTDLEKVTEITSKIDNKLTDLINDHMSSAYKTNSELVHLTAIVSSLSFYLGKAIVQLASYSPDKIHSLIVASGKIVRQGIDSSMNEYNQKPNVLN